jgi:hypothetical protein
VFHEPARGFALFTERAGEWWPSERRHTEDSASTIRIEPEGAFFFVAARAPVRYLWFIDFTICANAGGPVVSHAEIG